MEDYDAGDELTDGTASGMSQEADTSDDGDVPFNALDLPQLFKKPSYEEMVDALFKLRVGPRPWNSRERKASAFQSPRNQQAIARYLSTLTSNSLHWLTEERKEVVWELASTCLSERCGRSGVGAITRLWEITPDLKLEIHEPPLTGDNLGFKTWGSAYHLAKRLELISEAHPVVSAGNPMLKVLELGSGTGLVGLAAAAIWKCMAYLTDLPDIVENLDRNIECNCVSIGDHGGSAESGVIDWSSPPTVRLGGTFPVIITADPLYSPEHPRLLGNVINDFLLNDHTSRVIMELPLRDAATKAMLDDLCEVLNSHGFSLLEHGTEVGYDDWEENGDLVEVEYWWGIWGRGTLRVFEG